MRELGGGRRAGPEPRTLHRAGPGSAAYAPRPANVQMIDDPSIIWTSVIQTLLLPYLAGLQVESPEKLLDAFENRRDDPQGGAGAGRRLVDAAMQRAAPRRCAGHPLLHGEPLCRDASDPPGSDWRSTLGTCRLNSPRDGGASPESTGSSTLLREPPTGCRCPPGRSGGARAAEGPPRRRAPCRGDSTATTGRPGRPCPAPARRGPRSR